MEGGGERLLPVSESDNEVHEGHLSHSISPKDSIRRIPDLFKMRNEKAYTPYKFSIGPWHYGKTELLRTGQKLKESSLEGLLARFPDRVAKRRELEEAIHNVHDQARECYEGGDVYHGGEDIDVARREFEEILLLDGCFIIELFRKNAWQVPTSDDVSLLLTGAFSQVFYHDLLLLDNQIPWSVLELLFDETTTESSVDGEHSDQSLVKLALEFFEEAFPHHNPLELFRLQSGHDLNYLHLVHFVWCFWVVLPGNELPTFNEGDYRTVIPSATRLKEAGVKFQKAESGHILNVKFSKGVLEIRPLLITPLTENIFRNFIIFEQYSIFSNPYVTCYAIFLDCLIDTSDDVDLMSRAEVFINRLNPEETANFFNRLRDNTHISEFCYAPLCKEINGYCDSGWPRWRASLIQNYFTKPWAIVSVVFAVIALFFTIMQVFYK